MKIAFDTNAYRALQENHALFASLLRAAAVVGMPSIVLGEIRAGFAYGAKTEANTIKLDHFLVSDNNVRVLDVNEFTAHHYAALYAQLRKVGRPIPTNDIWIAALCLQHGFALATLDKDFAQIPQLQKYGLEG